MVHGDGEQGSAVVEFALVVPLLLLLVFALVEIAVVGTTQIEVVNAAREGARESATHPDPARAVRAAQQALGPAGGRARISVVRPDQVGARTTVTVRLPVRLGAPIFGGARFELRASATMRIER